ncbi:hypothetical protein QVD17_19388 [Tagetes erecta]|uniref:HAT C-terminal dimerisation domain-containing protein n=1 Tax=Tagetes erecta TaxID=13708 RepID=A0AAD8KMY3_TARER|nr:hypothetical protein QVD17_19388 [Tagetes erecta]
MAFGKGGSSSSRHEAENSNVQVLSDNEIEESDFTNTGAEVQRKLIDDKPLLQEVEFIGAGNSKNSGGSKVWVCKHCGHRSTSSYTRIHVHSGKKADIKRCTSLLQDREKYGKLLKRVKDAEKVELAEVAMKVLSQPISSSSAERNWSTYSYIHSVKRNRLNNKRADKLVFINSNIRLQSRFSDSYNNGPTKKWDMNPENNYFERSSIKYEDMQ